MDRRSLLQAGLAAGGMLVAGGIRAQPAWAPTRPLRIVVPFGAGGPTDVMARALGGRLGEALGQPVVVDNRPGGGAQIAAAAIKQSPADGHTLFIGDIGALAINATLFPNLSYDPVKDFAPVTMLMAAPMLLIVRADSPFRSLQDVVAAAKSGQKVTMASQGIGTGGHLLLEILNHTAAVQVLHVPYKGTAPAIQALVAGQVDTLFDLPQTALPHVQGGTARVIATASAKRAVAFPNVPTTAEAGLPEVQMDPWFAVVARAGTPEPAIRRLSEELGRAIRLPEVSQRFVDNGFAVALGTPAALGAHLKSEVDRWGAVVRRSGAKVE